MKFDPRTHIIGKVYDLTQENMNAMLAEIDLLRHWRKRDAAIIRGLEALAESRQSGYSEKPIQPDKVAQPDSDECANPACEHPEAWHFKDCRSCLECGCTKFESSKSCLHEWATRKHFLDVESNCYVDKKTCLKCNAEYDGEESVK